MNTIRLGVFPDRSKAERAIERLLAVGIDRDHVSVVCPQCEDDLPAGVEEQDPAGEHTVDASVKGGTVGALAGFLTAAIAIPATAGASVLVAGPILCATAAGAVSGGFIGAMMTRGFEPAIADYYDQAVQRGRVLVAVESEVPGELELAEQTLDAAGAEPVELPAEG